MFFFFNLQDGAEYDEYGNRQQYQSAGKNIPRGYDRRHSDPKPIISFKNSNIYKQKKNIHDSVNSIVEFPGAGLGRLRTINYDLNGAIQISEAAKKAE